MTKSLWLYTSMFQSAHGEKQSMFTYVPLCFSVPFMRSNQCRSILMYLYIFQSAHYEKQSSGNGSTGTGTAVGATSEVDCAQK